MAFAPGLELARVRKHLVTHLGKPLEVLEVTRASSANGPRRKIQLAMFGAARSVEFLIATVGISEQPMRDQRRVEGIVLLSRTPTPTEREGLARVLSGFAGFAENSSKPPSAGDVIRAPNELHRFSAMDALLCLPPLRLGQDMERVALDPHGHVEIIWLVPLYEAEATYALTHGPSSLLSLVAAQDIDLTQLERIPADTRMTPNEVDERAARKTEPTAASSSARGPRASYEALDNGETILIRRRPPRPSRPKAAPPPPAEAPPETRPEPSRHPRPAPPPRTVTAPEPVVRFHLPTPSERPSPGAKLKAREGARAQVSAEKPSDTPGVSAESPPETPAEAKQKRIEALKQRAKETAARRAAARDPTVGHADAQETATPSR